jgi:hypothetical protein
MLSVVSSMNSTSISTAFCNPPGTPAVADTAALRNKNVKTRPSPMDHAMESTLIDQKPMAAASSALWAIP